jgi:hypothetical protein
MLQQRSHYVVLLHPFAPPRRLLLVAVVTALTFSPRVGNTCSSPTTAASASAASVSSYSRVESRRVFAQL